MEQWNWIQINGIEAISYNAWLQQGINIAFSSRFGGVSRGIYTSLNLGLHVGDQNEMVLTNRQRYLAIFNAGLDDAVCCEQVHGNQVVKIDASHRGRGAKALNDVIKGYDAMITIEPGIYLLAFFADCIPLYFFDPVHRAIGLAHSGWKGTMGRIAIRTLAAMQKEFGTCSSDLQVLIGPGIGPCCFEIQTDLARQVSSGLDNLHDIINTNQTGNLFWDLQESNRQLLLQAGVNSQNIGVCRICTSCNQDMFYSYRKENGRTGRMGALIGIDY